MKNDALFPTPASGFATRAGTMALQGPWSPKTSPTGACGLLGEAHRRMETNRQLGAPRGPAPDQPDTAVPEQLRPAPTLAAPENRDARGRKPLVGSSLSKFCGGCPALSHS